MKDLSIVIVSWNVCELLRACLDSIFSTSEGIDVEVIVVDSNSTDGSQEMVARDFAMVRLVAKKENVGFPRGNNIGMKLAQGRNILLLNPDTVIVDGAIGKMVAFLDEHPDVGVVGPLLVNTDGSPQSSRRRFPQLTTALFESTWLQSVAPRRFLDRYYVRDKAEDVQVDVDWLTGACLMVPRRVVEVVGSMDEAYFMYSEELDWCRRINEAGFRVVYFPEARVVHHMGKSSEQAVTERHINFQRAKLRYFRKYHGRRAAFSLRVFLLTLYAVQIVVEAFKGLVGHKRRLRLQRIQAYWRVLRSGLRPAGY